MGYTHITSLVENRIAHIRLSRPEKRNALNDVLVRELTEAFSQVGRNSGAKVIILSGSKQAFCAGADLSYLQKLSTYSLDENKEDSRNLMKLFQTIYEVRKPVIAMVNGPALAGGCGLATVCDFVFASKEHARFGYTEVKIGFLPALVLVFLTRRIGEGRARELLLTGKIVDAATALSLGLITEVVDHNKLEGRTLEFANELVEGNSANSMALTKEMLTTIRNMDYAQALEYAANMNAMTRMTDDWKKGVAAFLNKEQNTW
jgi:methylglutaconyl-CoA hydratase